MNNKIGLLLPRSVIFPAIAFDLVAGIRYGLEKAGIQGTEFKTEGIGTGADDKKIYAICEQMIFEGIKIICGYINPVSAEKLQPLLAGGGAMLIVLDAGYHYPSSMQKQNNVFYLSLQGALCSRIATKMAVADGVKRIAFTGSYYESGYRSIYSFYRCIEEEGVEVTYNHFTKLKRQEFSMEPLNAHLAQDCADGVFATFCGDMLQDFYSTGQAENGWSAQRVYGAPFTADEVWLEQSSFPGTEVITCVPWGGALDNEENRKFCTQMKQQDRQANLFSALGHDAGAVLAKALAQDSVKEAIAVLEDFAFDGPRGIVKIEADTHHGIAPLYEAAVIRSDADNKCVLRVGAVSPYFEDQLVRWKNDINTQPAQFTSWYNAYGCLDS